MAEPFRVDYGVTVRRVRSEFGALLVANVFRKEGFRVITIMDRGRDGFLVYGEYEARNVPEGHYERLDASIREAVGGLPPGEVNWLEGRDDG